MIRYLKELILIIYLIKSYELSSDRTVGLSGYRFSGAVYLASYRAIVLIELANCRTIVQSNYSSIELSTPNDPASLSVVFDVYRAVELSNYRTSELSFIGSMANYRTIERLSGIGYRFSGAVVWAACLLR